MSISEQLKAAVRASGLSHGEIAKAAGIHQPGLSRFLSDDPDQHRDIRLERTADRLAEYLGLSLVGGGKAEAKPRAGATKKSAKPPAKTPAKAARKK